MYVWPCSPVLAQYIWYNRVSVKGKTVLEVCVLIHLCIDAFQVYNVNLFSDVMVSVLSSSVVDRGSQPRLGQTKDYKIGICCFSIQHVALRSTSKTDWLIIRVMCQGGASCLSVVRDSSAVRRLFLFFARAGVPRL